jgi:hypothetical protein
MYSEALLLSSVSFTDRGEDFLSCIQSLLRTFGIFSCCLGCSGGTNMVGIRAALNENIDYVVCPSLVEAQLKR